MSIPTNSYCVECLLNKHLPNVRTLGDDETAYRFSKALMQLFLDADPKDNSSVIGARINQLYMDLYGLPQDRFQEEKEASNRFVMERLEQIRVCTESAADPVYAGLQMAVLGNYIDFSALQGEVSFDKLEDMLQKALQMELDRQVYHRLRQELSTARRLLYLTDNAGEIGFDRIFAEQLQKAYPQLQITFCVRGGPAQNDATRADAAAVGIPFPVIDNGNTVPGTELSLLSSEAKRAMEAADVILSKGQGNAETLLGCGYNIYYAFLIKCPRFIDRYQKPKLTAMLVAERE